MPFAAMIAPTVTPKRSAIAKSVSPDLTMYTRGFGVGVGVGSAVGVGLAVAGPVSIRPASPTRPARAGQ